MKPTNTTQYIAVDSTKINLTCLRTRDGEICNFSKIYEIDTLNLIAPRLNCPHCQKKLFYLQK